MVVKPSIKSSDVFRENTIESQTTSVVCPVKRPVFISAIYLVAASLGDKESSRFPVIGKVPGVGPLKLSGSVL